MSEIKTNNASTQKEIKKPATRVLVHIHTAENSRLNKGFGENIYDTKLAKKDR